MREELKYIDDNGALEVYRKTVAASGGGLQGVKDGGIQKVLDFDKAICTIRYSLRN